MIGNGSSMGTLKWIFVNRPIQGDGIHLTNSPHGSQNQTACIYFPLFWVDDVPLFWVDDVPLFWVDDVPLFWVDDVPLFWVDDVPLFWVDDVPLVWTNDWLLCFGAKRTWNTISLNLNTQNDTSLPPHQLHQDWWDVEGFLDISHFLYKARDWHPF